MDTPGAMLMACKETNDESQDSNTLSVLGFYSYSYLINNERGRYNVIYMLSI